MPVLEVAHRQQNDQQPWLKKLGPGLITGAADDDPSGIATYSQAGAQFGFGLLWTLLFSYPLMTSIQIISARIGRVTGHGLACSMRKHYPAGLVYSMVSLLLVANTINIAADIAAMGDAMKLLTGWPAQYFAVAFGLFSLLMQIWVTYAKYVRVLKWLTLALLAYVATLFAVNIPWQDVAIATIAPDFHWRNEYLTTVVAVLGTTISPYMFFWQASQETEEMMMPPRTRPLTVNPHPAHNSFRRINIDTFAGMAFSNIVAFCIMLTTAVALHQQGISEIKTSADAASALRPVAGDLAFFLFALGIIGTGLLAVPVLAGSAAYAMADTFKWRHGLSLEFGKARNFYGIIAISTLIGTGLCFAPIDPIRALYWSAVINGIISVPIMACMMRLAGNADVMGQFVLPRKLHVLGWLTTAVMGLAVVFMLAAMLNG